MATAEQIERIVDALQAAHPKDLFQTIDETQVGIGAVLRLLYESTEIVTAGKIAEYMNVSTARVAVLLKKMVAKDLIVKEVDANDARVTVVQLSEHGRITVETMRNEIHRQFGTVIDKIGMERMMEFVAISREIQNALKETHLTLQK